MLLTSGARLGPYEIEAAIGAGGMGEVYRARDARLGRTVAIKIVSPELARTPAFRQRLEREARAISALNHPHICALYDIGQAIPGPSPNQLPNYPITQSPDSSVSYLVMEHVEGETLAQVLKRGPLPIDLALEYGSQMASALGAAHTTGIVHRDLKPANIMITGAGVKVLDFGLAKRAEGPDDEPAETQVQSQATAAGAIVGTLAYLSPEQADGKPLDARSDVFSLGVVLYEMLCGRRPFKGDTTLSTLAAILRERPEPPRAIRHEIPENVQRIVVKCLEKSPDARYRSAADLERDLEAARPKRARLGRGALVAAIVLAGIGAGAAGYWLYQRSERVRWAEREALPEVARLMDAGRPLAALKLLREAQEAAPASLEAARLSEGLFVWRVSIQTNPPGAEVSIRDYVDEGGGQSPEWEGLGRTPLETDRVPRGHYRLRVVKDGFVTVEGAIGVFPVAGGGAQTISIELRPPGEMPQGMVWVPGIGKTSRGTGQVFPAVLAVEAPGFWLDKYEVTNRDFKAFLDAGGYAKREYWKQPFVKNGRAVSWDEAVGEFRDATGRPGPATWELGTYPEKKADLPVGGVSWYEAAAYAEFAGKSLPTVYHWYRAADVGGFADVLKFSNFGGQGPAPVGRSLSLGAFGTYDMAGNVKEWVLNASADRRYILGGGWNELSYLFIRPDARGPFERDATFGFRCAKYESPVPAALTGPVPFTNRDRRNDEPVDDRTFEIYRSLHQYDKTDLKPALESTDDRSPYWKKEDVSFQAAYGNERVIAHLYLPKNAQPPYQVLTFFGGTSTLTTRTFDDEDALVSFGYIVRSGRAVMLSAYKGTLERGPGAYYHQLGEPNRWREMNLQWSKDLGRSLDYLETRPDIDVGRLGYLGTSMGSALAPPLLAVEPRFKTAVLLIGGSFEKVPPEVDPWNYAPRVTIPILMVNGRDDFLFPLESSQVPFFKAFGTPEKDKRHLLYEGGHEIGNTASRLDQVKDVLDWLDRYLGPVQGRPQ